MDDQMTITFLGTGTSQGIPVIGSNHPVCLSKDPRDKRLRVSVLISWNNYNYVNHDFFHCKSATPNVIMPNGIHIFKRSQL